MAVLFCCIFWFVYFVWFVFSFLTFAYLFSCIVFVFSFSVFLYVYFPVGLFLCLSVSVKSLAVKTASEMT